MLALGASCLMVGHAEGGKQGFARSQENHVQGVLIIDADPSPFSPSLQFDAAL